MSDDKSDPIVIKKYANRRLYNTASSAYVTLDDLSQMVKDGSDFVVHDAKSGENITRQVLTQIIFEEEAKGENLLPIDFLRQLIRFYGDSMQAFVPSYLQFSMEHLTREHERLREEMVGTAGTEMIKSMEDQARKNMAMFQDAMQLFNPFAAMQNVNGAAPEAAEESAKPETEAEPEASSETDLKELQNQIKTMQSQIEKLAGKD
ncbi:polyhydroxyalkanoate synthesis repressor PhaR [Anderseniella sp. Alg231-50]|uniref:polyhydroxyalkanoate synthesis repressor PhaR n=1 Tax=Anderseniella sp. Alg231-50 TaxID=1922226 RepID=UPI000D552A99